MHTPCRSGVQASRKIKPILTQTKQVEAGVVVASLPAAAMCVATLKERSVNDNLSLNELSHLEEWMSLSKK